MKERVSASKATKTETLAKPKSVINLSEEFQICNSIVKE